MPFSQIIGFISIISLPEKTDTNWILEAKFALCLFFPVILQAKPELQTPELMGT